MTSNEIWDQLVRKQPKLLNSDSTVEFTAGDLRKLLRQVYEQGEASVPRDATSRGLPPPFDQFFGGKP